MMPVINPAATMMSRPRNDMFMERAACSSFCLSPAALI